MRGRCVPNKELIVFLARKLFSSRADARWVKPAMSLLMTHLAEPNRSRRPGRSLRQSGAGSGSHCLMAGFGRSPRPRERTTTRTSSLAARVQFKWDSVIQKPFRNVRGLVEGAVLSLACWLHFEAKRRWRSLARPRQRRVHETRSVRETRAAMQEMQGTQARAKLGHGG